MMRIANLMLGAGRGGLEQAAIDFAEALRLVGVEVTTVTVPGAWANAGLAAAGLDHRQLRVSGFAGLWAPVALRGLLETARPTHVLCHGNRALKLAGSWIVRSALPGCHIVGITHNYSLKHIARADHVLALTGDLARAVAARGVAQARIHRIGNLVRVPPSLPEPRNSWRDPPVIGSIGRLVAKKGYEVFIAALGQLAARGCRFRAVLAGDGPEAAALKAQAASLGLEPHLTFAGWVDDRQGFYDSVDIAVVPSHHEPFGIVVLEAMAQGLPLISTASEGPSEILADGAGGKLVPLADPTAMADALEALLADPVEARALGDRAHATALARHDIRPAAQALFNALGAMG